MKVLGEDKPQLENSLRTLEQHYQVSEKRFRGIASMRAWVVALTVRYLSIRAFTSSSN